MTNLEKYELHAKKLNTLLRYYLSSRGVGHSTLMVDGVKNAGKDIVVIVPSLLYGERFKKEHGCEIATIDSVDRLRGSKKPIAIDNGTMIQLLDDSLETIEGLTSIVDSLENENNNLKRNHNTSISKLNDAIFAKQHTINVLQSKIHELSEENAELRRPKNLFLRIWISMHFLFKKQK